MYKTYLVTGATGFLGRTVVSELLSRGASVRALVLPGDRLAGVLPESVERTEGGYLQRVRAGKFLCRNG